MRRFRLLLVPLVTLVPLAGCGARSADPANRFSGERRAVAETVYRLQDAGKAADARTICTQLFATQLTNELRSAGRDCEKGLTARFKIAADFSLSVESVVVAGDQAVARVRSNDSGKDRFDRLLLRREAGRWRISGFR